LEGGLPKEHVSALAFTFSYLFSFSGKILLLETHTQKIFSSLSELSTSPNSNGLY